jgi:DNA-binding transcriptional MerR regulator
VETLTVGTVAKRTGLSVRTLHHYDAIGLLTPARRTEAGYRLYSVRDLMRLQQVVLLRSLGLPLDDIAESLARGGQTLLRTIEEHTRQLHRRIEREQALCRRLEATMPTVDDILQIIVEVAVSEKYFTPEQREWLQRRAEQVGPERIKQVEQVEWPTLIAEVRAEMDKGTPPDAAHVRALAARWTALVEEFTNGNLGIARAVATVYKNEPSMRQKTGIDGAMMEYMSRAGALKKV